MENELSTQMDFSLQQSRRVIITLMKNEMQKQMKLLLEEENDEHSIQEYINKCDLKTGLTPLQCAIDKLLHVCNNHDDVEKEEEGNSNNDDHYFKSIQSIKEIIKLLLKHIADINAKPSKEDTI